MRGAFGLVGLLVTAGIVVWLMFGGDKGKSYVETVGSSKKHAETQVQAISGRDAQGDPVTASLKLEVVSSGGHATGVRITSIDATGAIAKKYGLQVGDVITEFGPLPAGDFADDTAAAAQLQDAYQRSMPLTVLRNGQKLTLPKAGGNAPTGQDVLNSIRQPR
jgi:S1-C subfamily serine protease